MSKNTDENLIEALRHLAKDAIDYFHSVVSLLQARIAAMALSSVLFIILIGFAALTGLGAFLFFNIAFGMWLTHVMGSPFWSVMIMGIIYSIFALLAGSIALRWLNQLKS